MVKLTQVDDETATQFQKAPAQTFSDSGSDSESDYDDDFDIEAETFYDRIVALKDIIPPNQRNQLSDSVTKLSNVTSTVLNRGGALLWGVTSLVLLLGVPLALAILAETQLQEMEKEMSLQKSAQEVLTPGVDGAYDKQT